MTDKDVLKGITNYLVLINEIEIVKNEKLTAVIDKNYNVAATLREQEVDMLKQLPTLSTLKSWAEQLSKVD